MLDTKRLADTLVSGAKTYIDKALAGVIARVEALEKRTPEKGERGEKGVPGETGAPGIGLAAALIDREGQLVVTLSDGSTKALGEVMGRDGLNGKDGERGPPGERGEKGVAGERGENGRDGIDGKDGVDGKDGADGADADPDFIKSLVADAVSLIPAPRDGKDGADGAHGKDGKDGRDGKDGENGKDGADGLNGKDGIGVAGAAISRDGGLVLTTSDGRTHELGAVVGKDGERGQDGADGKDGLGFDDMEFEHDGERGFTFKFVRGERVKEFTFKIPAVIDRGVFKSDSTYEKGDGVTFGGHYWIAQSDTNEKPETSKAWRMAVRKGRDGRDGRNGERGLQGPEGKPGRDLTQLGPDGAKW